MKLIGLTNLSTRLSHLGGSSQQGRMILEKRRTLEKVFDYSYQGAKVQSLGSNEVHKALINPNRLKQDYDDKIISIGFESGFQIGTVFTWLNTNSNWIIYLQDLTELAYFRGDIRRCTHQISWKDEEGNINSSYIAIIGPQEKNIDSITKHGLNIDIPNYTLQIILPKTKETLSYFTRYSKFYLNGLEEYNSANKICWRVEAIDSITSPGILEVYANEYYANEAEDDVDNGIAGGLIVEPIAPQPSSDNIVGDTFIKPHIEYSYKYVGSTQGEWKIISKNPIEFTIDNQIIKLTWTKMHGGEFILRHGSDEKIIIVDSLF